MILLWMRKDKKRLFCCGCEKLLEDNSQKIGLQVNAVEEDTDMRSKG